MAVFIPMERRNRSTRRVQTHSELFDNESNITYPNSITTIYSEKNTSELFFPPEVLSRTPLLILDYMQFKAARTIQRHWRGFFGRKNVLKRRNAAILIQKCWRGFFVRRSYLPFVENKLQEILAKQYNIAATKIQALFRGWWIRQTVHDMNGLHRMQICAAEDLLSCVAIKLHHLLRTYSIPGVYSMRNSHCLSRVEKLLSSVNFRYLNTRVYKNVLYRQSQVQAQRQKFDEAKYYTDVPYKGPNFKGACSPICDAYLYGAKNMEKRMFKIITAYDNSMRDARLKEARYNLAERTRRNNIKRILEKSEKKKRNFCTDVINSMRRWDIWDFTKFEIDLDIFRSPGNLERFLDDAFNIVGDIKGRCHCKIVVHDEIVCT